MYFQKLENLKIENSKLSLIVDSLDQWLAYVPNSYKNKIWPELFANNENVPIDVCIFLFDELTEMKILKEKFVVECECGHTLEISNSLEDALDFILEYNSEETSCNACEGIHKISTDNIFSIYELIEKPLVEEMLKKKVNNTLGINATFGRKNLSDKILDNPQKYKDLNIKEKIFEAAPEEVRSKLLIFKKEKS